MTSTFARRTVITSIPDALLPDCTAVLGSPTPGNAASGKADQDAASSAATQLGCLLQQLQSVTNQATKLILSRSEEALSSRPVPGTWSVAECLAHMALTTQVFLPSISSAIATSPKLTAERRLRPGRLAGLLIRTLEPPYRVKHKVLACLVPHQHDFRPAWKEFLDSQAQLAQVIRSSIGLAIDRVRIQSPACARVSYNVYGALGILSAHQRRHLWQIERILSALSDRAA